MDEGSGKVLGLSSKRKLGDGDDVDVNEQIKRRKRKATHGSVGYDCENGPPVSSSDSEKVYEDGYVTGLRVTASIYGSL